MAYPGPGIGPWHVAEVDVHLINDIFRQIEEQINLLRGLRSTITTTGTGGTGFTIAKHSHNNDAEGGQISHDTALDDVSVNDHHDEVHNHSGPSSGGTLVADMDGVEGWLTGAVTDKILAGTGVTITEHDESGAITLSTSGAALTVEEEDASPSVSSVTTIKVTNGTLTDNGGGSVSIAIGSGTSETDQALYDAFTTASAPIDYIIAGAGVTITESDESNAVILSSQILTNGDSDTPEVVFADGELVYA